VFFVDKEVSIQYFERRKLKETETLLNIIKAEKRHLPILFELNQILYPISLHKISPFPWAEQAWINSNLKYFFVAVDDSGQILGAICVKIGWFESSHLVTLAVFPEFQKKGIGRALVEFAKEKARAKKKTKMSLGSYVVYDKKEFYERCGFHLLCEHFTETKDGEKIPYYCMEAQL
jgi:GNAT superfamily N-acetyltransferase